MCGVVNESYGVVERLHFFMDGRVMCGISLIKSRFVICAIECVLYILPAF